MSVYYVLTLVCIMGSAEEGGREGGREGVGWGEVWGECAGALLPGGWFAVLVCWQCYRTMNVCILHGSLRRKHVHTHSTHTRAPFL